MKCNQRNCSTLSLIQDETTVGYNDVYVVYHLNYTGRLVGANFTKSTVISGDSESPALVRLLGNCYKIDKQLSESSELALAGVRVSYLNFVVKYGDFFQLLADSRVELNHLNFYGERGSSSISKSLITATKGHLYLTTVNVQRVSVSGSSLIDISGVTDFQITDSAFYHISSTHSGGVLSATVNDGQSCTITRTSFTHTTSSGNGGAIDVTVSGSGSFTLQGDVEYGYVYFDSCSSKTKAGALSIDASSTATVTLSLVKFVNCTAPTAQASYLSIKDQTSLYFDDLEFSPLYSNYRKNHVYIDTNSNSFAALFKSVPNCYSSPAYLFYLPSTFVYRPTGGSTTDLYTLYESYSVLNNTAYPTENGCSQQHKCSSIAEIVQLGTKPSHIILNDGEHNPEPNYFYIDFQTTITGEEDAVFPIVKPAGSLNYYSIYISSAVALADISFSVSTSPDWTGGIYVESTGSLTVRDCSFAEFSSDENDLSQPLLYVKGELALEETSFYYFNLRFYSLLYFENGEGYLLNSNFTRISLEDADNSAAALTLYRTSNYDGEDGPTCQIIGCIFDDCESDGSGGAIYSNYDLYISSPPDMGIYSSVYDVPQTQFIDCSAKNYGGAIYLDHLTYGTCTFGNVEFKDNHCLLAGYETNAVYAYVTTARQGTLAYLLSDYVSHNGQTIYFLGGENTVQDLDNYPRTLYVSGFSDGSSKHSCKSSSDACLYLQTAANKADADHLPTRIMLLSSECTSETASYYVMYDHIGQSRSGAIKKITDLGNAQKIYQASGGSFTSFRFRLVSNQNGAAFLSYPFDVNTLSMSFYDTTFEQVAYTSFAAFSPLGYSLITVSNAGTLVLSDCSFADFLLNSVPLITITSGSIIVPRTTVFDRITRQSGDGSVFQIDLAPASHRSSNGPSYDEDDSLTIANVTIRNCACQNGNGGGMAVRVGEDSNFVLTSVTFSRCSASRGASSLANTLKAASVGGGLYVDVTGEPDFYGFYLHNVQASGCTADIGPQFFGGSSSEDLAFDPFIWQGIISGTPSDGEYVVGVTSTSGSTVSVYTDKVMEVSEVIALADQDVDTSTFPVALVVVLVVLFVIIIAVVIVVVLCCCVCKKDSSSSSSSSQKETAEEPSVSYPAEQTPNPLYQ